MQKLLRHPRGNVYRSRTIVYDGAGFVFPLASARFATLARDFDVAR